ncbi:MAG: CHAT domain-containing protein [Rhizonema sp. PD37]|nr:CHAT domain-containing protein [Rhizonema sp. PD37]
MKPIKQNWKKSIRFCLPMVLTALLCITSPSFAQIPIIKSAIAQTQTAPSLDQQARKNYQEGQFSEAAKLFQQASLAYQSAKDPIRQALSLSNLSLCYQQLAQWNDASRTITDSIALLTSLKATNSEKLSALAQSFDIQGELQLARGQADAALKSWERATTLYTQLGKPNLVLTSQTNQAQALQNLGLYRRSISLLYTAFKLPQDTTDIKLKSLLSGISGSPETATALRTLGDSLRAVGDLPQARLVLERSLVIANKLYLPDIITLAQLSLGNTTRAEADFSTALNFYQQAATSDSVNLRIQAQINQLSLRVDRKQKDEAKSLLPQIQKQIQTLPTSYTAIEARVNLAQIMMKMRKQTPEAINLREVAELLSITVQQATDLGNPRLQADALGSLGNVYQENQQWAQAEKLTQQALQLAQQINAGDIAYRWQWQLGRITKAQGKIDSAIAAYKEAVSTIKSLRTDLAAASPDVQFTFRNAVEPIHRELVGLLVQSNQKDNFKIARDVIEGLQLVELDNFFREACLTGKPEQVDRVDERAAVIYPIILDDQLATIVSLPKSKQNSQTKDTRDFRYYKTNISKKEVEVMASRLRSIFNQSNTFKLTVSELQKMYDLVIRPEAADLAASKVDTLVFVLDGVLRNIPMAALHDGKNFLVEKYSIALTPGLQLLAPRSLKQERLGALVAGLSEARPPDFLALPNVEKEVQNIKSELPSQVLLNNKFTNSAFENKVSAVSYPIVHLATHAQFSSQADETFILTWNGKIKVNDLSSLLKTVQLSRNKPLELLILSACQTATGDDKSALGLAGVAVRSGASSTVATLWQINDEVSASLMGLFYEQLVQARKTGISKAEALRQAQLAILRQPKYQSPYYWGAFVLLGNWI